MSILDCDDCIDFELLILIQEAMLLKYPKCRDSLKNFTRDQDLKYYQFLCEIDDDLVTDVVLEYVKKEVGYEEEK